MPAELPAALIASLQFRGRRAGLVRQLARFRKSHHTVPDAANAATQAFLGQLAGPELAAEAEEFFQQVRAGLGYKRRDLQLHLGGGLAQLMARDFLLEIACALVPEEPARYAVTLTLGSLQQGDLVRRPEFDQIFARRFSELVFALRGRVKVEDLIDAIEGLPPGAGLSVTYPSDCRDCRIAAAGVAAEVIGTAAELSVVLPQPASPAGLLDAFADVRAAFQLSPVLQAAVGV